MFSQKINNRLKKAKLFLVEKTARLLKNKSFYVQGRMDIDKLSPWYDEKFNETTGGFYLLNDPVKRNIVDVQLHDTLRKDMLVLLMRSIVERKVAGAVAEVGVYKGETAKLLHYYLPEKKLYLFDTFQGFTANDISSEKTETNLIIDKTDFTNTNVVNVLNYINPINKNVVIVEGRFPDTVLNMTFEDGFALVHLDADLYAPTKNGLDYFYSKVNKGGFIIVHDYNAWPGSRKAVDEFAKEKNIIPIPLPDKSGSCLIVVI